MVAVARRDHPHLRFDVGSMTDLDLPDGSVAGLLAWFSLIHVPDDEVPGVPAHFRRVLRRAVRCCSASTSATGRTSRPRATAGTPCASTSTTARPSGWRRGCATRASGWRCGPCSTRTGSSPGRSSSRAAPKRATGG
ncbi:class I SAM-dependent methyltransferase [Saccharothrix longispora]|nr:class I SAM-dependent methyltransferase [Saccharothrix longispora]MDU0289291.1 class I SAM-dependent methyltransferase [Saccharothrix longispora]